MGDKQRQQGLRLGGNRRLCCCTVADEGVGAAAQAPLSSQNKPLCQLKTSTMSQINMPSTIHDQQCIKYRWAPTNT